MISSAVRLACAPGRVNIIGEHTDYNDLPVLPMAIDRQITFAFRPTGTATVALTNADPAFFSRTFDLAERIPPFVPGDWGNYAKAAAQALWTWTAEHCPARLPLQGMVGEVRGDIPSGAGLSSSSAMVVAISVALVDTNALPISPEELATLLADGEQYVGTRGGGMDQAASLLARAGCALHIDFHPLRPRLVPIAGDAVFIIADSLVKAEKAGAARLAYNTRVAECRLGLALLRHLAGPENQAAAPSLGAFMRAVPDWPAVLVALPAAEVTVAEVARLIGMPEDVLIAEYLLGRDGRPLVPTDGRFAAMRRCRHVLTEAQRVAQAEAALLAGDLVALGRLMDASHASCAEDYAISCPELNHLVTTLRRHGALGARLTGAGFGGCTIALVARDAVDDVLDGVWRDYYQPLDLPQHIRRDSVLFPCVPSAGAHVRHPE